MGMVKRHGAGMWVLRGYGIALGVCLTVVFLHGPAMPPSTVLIGWVGAVVLGGPWLALLGYELYQSVTLRQTVRRNFDATIAEVEEPRTLAATDAARQVLASSRALRKITSEASALGAAMVGDVEVIGGRPYRDRKAHYVRITSLDRGAVEFAWGVIDCPPLLRLHRWFRGRMADIESRSLYTQLTSSVIIRTTDGTWFPLDDGKWLQQHRCAMEASLGQMLEIHRGHVAAALAADPTATVERCCTMEDAQRLSARMVGLLREHMREVGIFSECFSAEFCSTSDPRVARIFREELLAARERLGYKPHEGGEGVVRPEYQGERLT